MGIVNSLLFDAKDEINEVVLVPPLFERDHKGRSRLAKSSYDFLFCKPNLRWLFNDYLPIGAAKSILYFSPPEDPRISVTARLKASVKSGSKSVQLGDSKYGTCGTSQARSVSSLSIHCHPRLCCYACLTSMPCADTEACNLMQARPICASRRRQSTHPISLMSESPHRSICCYVLWQLFLPSCLSRPPSTYSLRPFPTRSLSLLLQSARPPCLACKSCGRGPLDLPG